MTEKDATPLHFPCLMSLVTPSTTGICTPRHPGVHASTHRWRILPALPPPPHAAPLPRPPPSQGCTETIDDDDSANSATTTDDGSSSGPDISSLDCTEYDDDATYDSASCLSYDEVACEYNCQEGSFCSELCGDSAVGEYSCGNGAGAVCAMNMLNDLVSTCSLYQQFASNPTPYTKETTSMILADDDLSIGCDDHAYCEFCDDLCQDSFGDLGYAVFGDDLVELKKLGRWVRQCVRVRVRVCVYVCVREERERERDGG